MFKLLPLFFTEHLPEVFLFQRFFLLVKKKKLLRTEKKNVDLVDARFLNLHKILE